MVFGKRALPARQLPDANPLKMPKTIPSDSDLGHKLRRLIFFRILFASLLLGSTLFVHIGVRKGVESPPFLFLYGLTAALFGLSLLYSLLLAKTKHELWLAYAQIVADSLLVTLILSITGGFTSVFTFLYLVVIIYTSIIVYRRGSLYLATACSLQYTLLVFLEYAGWLAPFAIAGSTSATDYTWHYIVYRVAIIIAGCYAVAFLSSHLAEQARSSRKELKAMGERVRRVEKMAAVGEMGAGLAHEIKNPLASITGSIQLLREEIPYDPSHDKLMQIILREADRLSALVGNFLLFARPPSGRSEPIELDAAIPETIRLVGQDRRCREGITIHHTGDSGAWIAMDQDHFRQVLWNLLLNAVEAIEGQGKVSIDVGPAKGPYVHIRISDTGCGIPEENLHYIFDPFFTSKPSGTGLGLSIVHSILESYGGWLEVESRPGQGAQFTVKVKRIERPRAA